MKKKRVNKTGVIVRSGQRGLRIRRKRLDPGKSHQIMMSVKMKQGRSWLQFAGQIRESELAERFSMVGAEKYRPIPQFRIWLKLF